ncbi:MAG: coagulation factor 5/8 type domain-containing protein [Acidobacteriota bacterium]|nr:coagulation factor 5/8 type domain-containing protein [Acidobacteriota bacterium]
MRKKEEELSCLQEVFTCKRSILYFVVSVVLTAGALSGTHAIAQTRTPQSTPDFGPNVTVFGPGTSDSVIQAKLDAISTESEFSSSRHAILFKPGAYTVNSQVGYYTSVAGLGLSPDDVEIKGGLRAEGRIRPGKPTDSALVNFWRSLENLSVTPEEGNTRWAVSQASPLRRIHIRGGLQLMPAQHGYSSGGYISDTKVDGQVQSGSQQQWFSRNSSFGSWSGSNWNMVFSGVQGAPEQSFPSPPYTVLDTTPENREKPFLYIDHAGKFNVFVPSAIQRSSGTSWSSGSAAGSSLPIGAFFIAQPSDSAAQINAALASGKHLILTPGLYHLDRPLAVIRAHTVVLGLGFATLIAETGKPALTISHSEGVIIAGLIIDAGPVVSHVLLQVGTRRTPTSDRIGKDRNSEMPCHRSADPATLNDVFFRIGGATPGRATTSLEVNSDNVILDDIWAWRADHGTGVGWTQNTADHGVVVNGTNVTALGLAVEHYQKEQVQWNGNCGESIFYQSELPYDPPTQSAWMHGRTNGYESYVVSDMVNSHRAWGLGVYSYLNAGPEIVEDRAILVPKSSGVSVNDAVTVFLNGHGSITHVVNDTGGSVSPTSNRTAYLARYPK